MKGWRIDDDVAFNRFCEMLSSLSQEQQNCVLQITENFLRVDLDKYFQYIKLALNCLDLNKIEKISRIFVMPLNTIEAKIEKMKSPKQRKNPGNSSIVIAYAFNETNVKGHANLKAKTVNVIYALEGLPKNFNSTNGLLLLVDDFIGSGETFETCVKYLSTQLEIDSTKVYALALVGQREGLERLRSQNIDVCCPEVRLKGITDYFQAPARDELIGIMESIEDLLGIDQKYRFGYSRSEAVVKMIRTPNNTFPVYWYPAKLKDGRAFAAPFPR